MLFYSLPFSLENYLLMIQYSSFGSDFLLSYKVIPSQMMNWAANDTFWSWNTMKDSSDDPLHIDRMLLPQSYISLHGRKEGNVLFNGALNTFYLRLYGVRHMVKDHSDSKQERKPAAAT